eukprot:c107_g1_i1 orf=69-458(+)
MVKILTSAEEMKHRSKPSLSTAFLHLCTEELSETEFLLQPSFTSAQKSFQQKSTNYSPPSPLHRRGFLQQSSFFFEVLLHRKRLMEKPELETATGQLRRDLAFLSCRESSSVLLLQLQRERGVCKANES